MRNPIVESALLRVFGEEGHRTGDQETVMNWLRANCYVDRPTFVASKDGAMCPYKAAVAEGRREIWLELHHQLAMKNVPIGQKPKNQGQ